MGFGTLFIGYFLLLNLTYYGFTDIIAAAVMLLGLYKLSRVNRYFKLSAIASTVFLTFSLGELGIAAYEMFARNIDSHVLVSVMSIVRCLIIGALTVLMLLGIEAVAREVEIDSLPNKARRMAIVSGIVYAAWVILEAPLSFVNDYVLAVLSLITIIATLALLVINLTLIYTCYMKICMPGDEDITREKPSRFEFVNEYRARKAEREEEAAQARAKAMKERAEKKRGKKK